MQYSLNIIFGMTIDLKSLIFEAREMDLSSHMTFSFDSELCALAILERISGLEPLSVTRAPRYVNWLTYSSVVPFTIMSFFKLFAWVLDIITQNI